MSDELIVETRDRVLRLTLNRPERLNAFTWAMRDEMIEAVSGASDVDAIVVTGRGRGFCAGVDVGSVLHAEAGAPAEERRANLEKMHGFLRLLRATGRPVVALVNGVAAGGGWSLALACDQIIAADSARFVTAFTKLGLVPDLGGAYSLTRRVGATRAKSIVMRGQTIDAPTALAIGAVDWVVPADQLETRFTELLPQILAAGTGR